MKIDFPYPGYEQIASVEVPDANLMGVYAPHTLPGIDEEAVLAEGFANPIGAPRLRFAGVGYWGLGVGDKIPSPNPQHLTPGAAPRVLILVDDHTRGTPVPRIMPYVLEELRAAGIGDEQITLLTAPGTHRPMTEGELREKLGKYYGRFPLHQHRWLDESNLRDFGHTADGTHVRANRLLAEADFVLGLGSIVPHRVKGFSGGAKIAFPGVAGREMMEHNQWQAAQRMSETVMGVAENPMRERMEEAARLVGLRYIINLVSDFDKRIVGCFVGDPVLAHREGCKLSYSINAVTLPRRADIVLIDSQPADIDFWQ